MHGNLCLRLARINWYIANEKRFRSEGSHKKERECAVRNVRTAVLYLYMYIPGAATVDRARAYTYVLYVYTHAICN